MTIGEEEAGMDRLGMRIWSRPGLLKFGCRAETGAGFNIGC